MFSDKNTKLYLQTVCSMQIVYGFPSFFADVVEEGCDPASGGRE